MAKAKKKAEKAPGNGANLGFEQKLWAAADKLRGHMKIQALLMIGISIGLVGCAHGLIGELPEVGDAARAAEIVIVRPARFIGAAVSRTITLDGKETYAMRSGEHIVMRVTPGERIIGVKYWGPMFNREEQTLALKAESGQRYYFRLDPPSVGAGLNRITAETAQELMKETTLLPR